jgi:hypothetical protein
MDDSSFEDGLVTHIVTVKMILDFGLAIFFTQDRIGRAGAATNIDRFNLKFGVQPITACMLYEDLQKTALPSARIYNPDDTTLFYFLSALYYLRKYPTESEMESLFDTS